MNSEATSDGLRIDKWLWAARFFKTRGLAADAVEGGKVRVNERPCKPSREVKAGDIVDVAIGDMRWTVTVCGVSSQRRPVPEARLLYQESDMSAARRAQALEMRKLAPTPGADAKGRPTKKAARQLRKILS